MTKQEVLKSVDQIVAVGSVDGVCTAAAVLRNAAEGANVTFTQAFTVDKLDPNDWQEGRSILFVDLAVNNRDEQMTIDFLRRITDAGHHVVGVLDEHNATDWEKAFDAAGLSYGELSIKPVSQDEGDIKSSGALLISLLGTEVDAHTRELCEAADAGDRMDFTTHFGGMVNQAVKSRIADDSRRVKLATYLSSNRDADAEISGWIAEYDAILRTHEEIVGAREELGDGLVRVSTIGKIVDVTTLMSQLYKLGYKVVV